MLFNERRRADIPPPTPPPFPPTVHFLPSTQERNQAKHEGWRSELEEELAKVKVDAREGQAELEKTLAIKAEAERERRTEHIQEMYATQGPNQRPAGPEPSRALD